MVTRSSERAGGGVVVVLLSLAPLEDAGKAPSAKALSGAMGRVRSIVMGGLLRKSDIVARYSTSQYIIMLAIERAATAGGVVERIRRAADPVLEPSGLKAVFATTGPGGPNG
jgi:hypothetical protein